MTDFDRTFTPAEIRKMLGMTVEETAKIFGISHMTLQRREAGESEWKAKEIKMLSELSHIPISRISF